jgi:predicted amidohydrolase YtcJ
MLKMFHNAHFFLDSGFNNSVIGLLVEDNMIIKLINNTQPLPSDMEMIDLRGGYVYPGFIDSHTHCFSGGLYLGGVDLVDCISIGDILDRIREAVKNQEGSVLAWHFDESNIKEKRFPTVRELDAVSPNNPLLLRRIDGHSCIINTKARSLVSGLDFKEEIFRGNDNDLVVNQLQDTSPPQTILHAYDIAAQAAMQGGFTTVHTMIGDAQYDNQHYRLISDNLDRFPIRFELYPQSFNIDDAIDLGSRRIGGCILADGSIGSYTAAISFTYAEKQTLGVLYHDQGYWNDFIAKAHKLGLQVCVHCIGDAAVKQINNAFRKLERSEVQELRHELIHCEVTPDALIEEIVESGAVPVMQPNFDLLWGGKHGLYEQRLGAVRSRQMNRFASLPAKACVSAVQAIGM